MKSRATEGCAVRCVEILLTKDGNSGDRRIRSTASCACAIVLVARHGQRNASAAAVDAASNCRVSSVAANAKPINKMPDEFRAVTSVGTSPSRVTIPVLSDVTWAGNGPPEMRPLSRMPTMGRSNRTWTTEPAVSALTTVEKDRIRSPTDAVADCCPTAPGTQRTPACPAAFVTVLSFESDPLRAGKRQCTTTPWMGLLRLSNTPTTSGSASCRPVAPACRSPSITIICDGRAETICSVTLARLVVLMAEIVTDPSA